MTHCKRKFMIDIWGKYYRSHKNKLSDCYKKHSRFKQEFFEYCYEIMNKYNGHSLRIISYNSYSFNCGFICTIGGQLSFVYITKDNIRYITDEDVCNYAYKQGRKYYG